MSRRTGFRSLAGAKVLVTGGSSGIGREIARAMASERASVLITGRGPQRLLEAAQDHPSIRTAVCV